MFSGFMVHAWQAGTLVALVAGVVGFFVVLRGAAFPAHAIPNGAFAGAAGASLLGASPTAGLLLASLLGALGIDLLGRRAKHDVATALVLVVMLGLGDLFVSQVSGDAEGIYALLFGSLFALPSVTPTLVLSVVCLALVVLVARPLVLSSTAPELAQVRGVPTRVLGLVFLALVALVTTLSVPLVGALLLFPLLLGPAAAAQLVVRRPLGAMVGSVLLSLITVWASLVLTYRTSWPVSFFVGVGCAGWYLGARVVVQLQRRSGGRS